MWLRLKKLNVYSFSWFFESTTRIEAEEMVMMESNAVGTFVLRPSERFPNCFSLTVKDFNVQDGYHVRNYRVKSDERGGFYISTHLRYRTLADLITDNRKCFQTIRYVNFYFHFLLFFDKQQKDVKLLVV